METTLRKQIIQSALILFEKHGYHGVSVNEIIKHANSSKGGFYYHFSAKDELLYVIHDEFITYVLDRASKTLQKYDEPKNQLKAVLLDFVKVFDLYKPHITVFYQESRYLSPVYEQRIQKKRHNFKRIISDIITAGIENGTFRSSLDVQITTMAILGIVNWTYMWYDKQGEKTIEEISYLYIDFILQSILVKDSTQ